MRAIVIPKCESLGSFCEFTTCFRNCYKTTHRFKILAKFWSFGCKEDAKL